ncbi:hypothetical protein [Microbacterium hominis]|uniref:Uncharacterized protein n=1 Tax=Microbacterium hominis TaxID=162426 RepID=A0A0B4D0R9_9MICO|nr:hypothetical protein [Microbacterium hominis]KIC57920.1 hypothetical protein RM52_07500 [Microbacterium hominis]
MKRAAYLAGLLVIAILMGGCATTSMPSYAEVTDEAKASLQEIVDLMPTGAVAGAGMPAAWRPEQGTDYEHWSYTDALSMAQATGWVWEGNNPISNPAFTSHIFPHDGDFTMRVPMSLATGGIVDHVDLPATTDPLGSHNLVASDSPQNVAVLLKMLGVIAR